MKKYVFFLLIAAAVVGFVFFKVVNWEDKAKATTTVEPALETNGCLGLNYHRVRKHNWFNRIVSSVTKSDELTEYSVYSNDFEHQLKKLKELDATSSFVLPYGYAK